MIYYMTTLQRMPMHLAKKELINVQFIMSDIYPVTDAIPAHAATMEIAATLGSDSIPLLKGVELTGLLSSAGKPTLFSLSIPTIPATPMVPATEATAAVPATVNVSVSNSRIIKVKTLSIADTSETIWLVSTGTAGTTYLLITADYVVRGVSMSLFEVHTIIVKAPTPETVSFGLTVGRAVDDQELAVDADIDTGIAEQ